MANPTGCQALVHRQSLMAAGHVIHPVTLDASALLALHAAFPQRYPALFESTAEGGGMSRGCALGRFDILFACPGPSLTLGRDGVLVDADGRRLPGEFLPELDRWWQQESAGFATPPGRSPAERERDGMELPAPARLPFTGGWLLYLGYELAAQVEPRLHLQSPQAGPLAQAIRVPAAIIRDRSDGNAWIVAERQARELIGRIIEDIGKRTRTAPPAELVRGAVTEDDPGEFLRAVARALEYIAAGDVYQANLSRTWRALLHEDVQPHHLYARLRETNPAPFSALAILGDIAVISSSPERLVEVREGCVATRPIAGTRPRGGDAAADRDLARELYAHPKERAEHVMLIDLERNDLGRVCEAGSVRVDEFMTIESYAHVHHIVSSVRGRLRAGVTPGDVLAAVFPGGTITGCPKVRCMEIIAELERGARGAYTGSLGYLNRDGSMDMNILIRSLEVHGAALALRAGAGIVADSVPARELEETRAKARGVLRALGAGAGAP